MKFAGITAALIGAVSATVANAQELTPYAYDIGSPTLREYFVDPSSGSDSNSGLSADRAWRTVQRAWSDMPASEVLSVGRRINLMNGSYGEDSLPNYWELRRGTAAAPIILRALPGQENVRFTRDINMANVSYFYLLGLTIAPAGGGDAFHCESCDHILLRGNSLNGGVPGSRAFETVKFNQSQYIFVENNSISSADDNNIDFVGVQYGHIIGNKVHDAQDWCAYVKGGSAYIRVEANEFYNCGTGGFTAGQGAGFQFMTSPWLHYEAYDIKFINNVVHDTEGAAFGVNGGLNVLMANNTAYRIGSRSHMVEVVFGYRSCDGASDGAAEPTCAAHFAAGGWGPQVVQSEGGPIGNKNVIIANNVLYNPAGFSSSQHFAIYGPRAPFSGMNLSSAQHTDENLTIRGNVIWNGGMATPLGIEDAEQGCQSGNATCTEAQIRAENVINSSEPVLKNPTASDFRPAVGSALLSADGVALSDFPSGGRPQQPASPEGNLSNFFDRDLSGVATTGLRIPGAYSSPDVSLAPPPIDGSSAPSDPGSDPGNVQVTRVQIKQLRKRRKVTLTVTATASGSPTSVSARVNRGGRSLTTVSLLSLGNGSFRAKATVTAAAKARLVVTVNADGTESSKTIRAK